MNPPGHPWNFGPGGGEWLPTPLGRVGEQGRLGTAPLRNSDGEKSGVATSGAVEKEENRKRNPGGNKCIDSKYGPPPNLLKKKKQQERGKEGKKEGGLVDSHIPEAQGEIQLTSGQPTTGAGKNGVG